MTTTQIRKKPARLARRRNGFSLLEVLVAISVLSLLLSLIAPGILSARSAASKTECTNNLKNLAAAAEILESTGETLTLETALKQARGAASCCRIWTSRRWNGR